jgi:hypothetical protein
VGLKPGHALNDHQSRFVFGLKKRGTKGRSWKFPYRLLFIAFVAAAMSTVCAMHEEMHAQARAKGQDEGQIADDMHFVFLPEEIAPERQKYRKDQPVAKPQGPDEPGFILVGRFRVFLRHGLIFIRCNITCGLHGLLRFSHGAFLQIFHLGDAVADARR